MGDVALGYSKRIAMPSSKFTNGGIGKVISSTARELRTTAPSRTSFANTMIFCLSRPFSGAKNGAPLMPIKVGLFDFDLSNSKNKAELLPVDHVHHSFGLDQPSREM